MGKRIVELEERVTALEVEIQKRQPSNWREEIVREHLNEMHARRALIEMACKDHLDPVQYQPFLASLEASGCLIESLLQRQ